MSNDAVKVCLGQLVLLVPPSDGRYIGGNERTVPITSMSRLSAQYNALMSM